MFSSNNEQNQYDNQLDLAIRFDKSPFDLFKKSLVNNEETKINWPDLPDQADKTNDNDSISNNSNVHPLYCLSQTCMQVDQLMEKSDFESVNYYKSTNEQLNKKPSVLTIALKKFKKV